MATHLHPGVFIEEIPSGAKAIEGVSTSVVALVGKADRGPANSPVLVHSLDEYSRLFGRVSSAGDAMGLAASAFYGNGGRDAWVLRLAKDAKTASCAIPVGGAAPTTSLTATALGDGTWANEYCVRVKTASDTATSFTLEVGRGEGDNFEAEEQFNGVTVDPNDDHYAPSFVRSGIITVSVAKDAGIPKAGDYPLLNGAATDPEEGDYRSGFDGLKKIRGINVVLLPGKTSADTGIIGVAVNHCEETGNRMVIVDPPKDSEVKSADDVDGLRLPTSTYSVAYYPWLEIPNPFDAGKGASTVSVAPSAFAAGLWARTDGRRGVWKAPAGTEAAVLGVTRPKVDVGDGDQDQLNPRGLNCIRVLPGFGPVVWGARTLATRTNPEWRYVSVRRTAIMIEESIYGGIQWAVFEPNDQNLWSSLRVNIESFMNRLFRAGAFQGAKASDAYFVRCGLGDTMTQDDIDAGEVIVVVGFAPLKPAEFVIVRIQQKLQQ